MPLIRDSQVFCFACLRAASNDGNRIAISSAMIAITTNNSMSVNPTRVELRHPFRLNPRVLITVILCTTCCFVLTSTVTLPQTPILGNCPCSPANPNNTDLRLSTEEKSALLYKFCWDGEFE